jgi:hypothetical protein
MKQTGLLFTLLLCLTLWHGCSTSAIRQRNDTSEAKDVNKTASPTPEGDPRPYSKNLDELRAQFNGDKGKVRLVTLLSPT